VFLAETRDTGPDVTAQLPARQTNHGMQPSADSKTPALGGRRHDRLPGSLEQDGGASLNTFFSQPSQPIHQGFSIHIKEAVEQVPWLQAKRRRNLLLPRGVELHRWQLTQGLSYQVELDDKPQGFIGRPLAVAVVMLHQHRALASALAIFYGSNNCVPEEVEVRVSANLDAIYFFSTIKRA
jgi:hypothetical protein